MPKKKKKKTQNYSSEAVNSWWDFPGGLDSKDSFHKVGDLGSIPGSGRSPEKEKATHSSILAWKIPWTANNKTFIAVVSKCKTFNYLIWKSGGWLSRANSVLNNDPKFMLPSTFLHCPRLICWPLTLADIVTWSQNSSCSSRHYICKARETTSTSYICPFHQGNKSQS